MNALRFISAESVYQVPSDPEADYCPDYLQDESATRERETDFRGLVQAIKGGEPSAWPASGEPFEWVTMAQDDYPDAEGRLREWTIHLPPDATPREVRAWRRAFKCAGFVR